MSKINFGLSQKQANIIAELYGRYKMDLYYTANSILNDTYESQDIVQTAFLNMAKHLEKIDDVDSAATKSYLMVIVRNLSFERYNERKHIQLVDSNDLAYLSITPDLSLDEYIIRIAESGELAKCLDQAKPEYADILMLRYYYSLSIPEIALLLSITENNTSVRIYRAKEALKKILDEGGAFHEQKTR